ncbi:nitroreductase family deazaflavin-dependent oxidoreductase [Jidongwangia harbinensis]|uniref:nitroreductase family deazaflavin-dependent oxidoreductase n=1 Tax=Jidongwangia harbinensis TaxID=2878561 RepID=UPI001CD97ABE|nr:nitroreductase family deazaflavin-dependent oxidoreductase [Jidongwangia harbinensis]MCA2216617.1 nitroreductase family deazaflavin-dependent oxidoreductase [Jidongwangia harbinensis]
MPSVLRFATRLASRTWFPRVVRRLVPVDRWVYQRTRGRFSPLGGRWLLPLMQLTTVGARSGLPRRHMLLYGRDGADLVVIDTNWGDPARPAWSANLIRHPEATVHLGAEEFRVRASVVTGAERDRLWAILVAIWPAYPAYTERVGDRDIRIFRLTRQP